VEWSYRREDASPTHDNETRGSLRPGGEVAGFNCSAPCREGGRTRLVKSNYVGDGVMCESGVKHSVDGAGNVRW
jgi:hypothetical protein